MFGSLNLDYVIRAGLIDILTPNESEAAVLSGQSLDDDESAARCTTFLRAKPKTRFVIVKRGSKGIVFDSGSGPRVFAAPKVEVRDTTAAGNSFNGDLGAALCDGSSLGDAIGSGIAAGALSGNETRVSRIDTDADPGAGSFRARPAL